MAEIRAGVTFSSFEEAKTAVEEFCRRNHCPVRVDKKETMSSFNSRAKEENRVTDKSTDDIYSYR